MTAHATDYRWFSEAFPGLREAYCLTLVEGVSPEELLRRAGAGPAGHHTGASELVEAAYDVWDEYDGDRLFIAATPLGGWALAVEPNGYLGITAPVLAALSAGTRLVSHFRNVNAVDHFHWQRDGHNLLHFEPLFPARRDGSEAGAAAGIMREAGFDLTEGDQHDHTLHTEAAFALAERLTGVRLTAELLESAAFVAGTAPRPRG